MHCEHEDRSRLLRLEREIIPALVNDHKFGDGWGVANVLVRAADKGKEHWASNTAFAEVRLVRADGSKTTKRLVVKYPPLNKVFADAISADVMFKNECFMYNKVLREYKRFVEQRSGGGRKEFLEIFRNLVPECYFAEFNPEHPELSIVVLEDARDAGFYPYQQALHMDLDHVTTSLQLIGRFHAISLAFQLERKNEHERMVEKIAEARFSERTRENLELSVVVGSKRALTRLLKDGGEAVPQADLLHLEEIFERAFDVARDMRTLDAGGLQVVCHGDFCSNNILYHHTQTGTPDHALLIDFQTPAVCSPTIDLSFFLFLNTDQDFRNQYLKKVLKSYHTSVIDTMTMLLGRDVTEPSLSFIAFQEDFIKHAAYGYLICGFFLPVMMAVRDSPYDLEQEVLITKKLKKSEKTKRLLQEGGEAATLKLVELFHETYQRGYFNVILNSYVVYKL